MPAEIIEDFEDGVIGELYPFSQDAYYSADAHTGSLAVTLPAPYVSPPSGVGIAVPDEAREFGIWLKVPYVLHGNARVSLASNGGSSEIGLIFRGEWYEGSPSAPEPTDGRMAIAQLVDGLFEDVADLGVIPWDQWLRFSVRPGGSWRLTDASGVTTATGSSPTLPATPDYGINALGRVVAGELLIDDAFASVGLGPIVRLFPRDDGRGMSSAPRIHPNPKGRSRIHGGFQ